MSYSACDFADDIAQMLDDANVPTLSMGDVREILGDPDITAADLETDGDASLRLLAERVRRALAAVTP